MDVLSAFQRRDQVQFRKPVGLRLQDLVIDRLLVVRSRAEFRCDCSREMLSSMKLTSFCSSDMRCWLAESAALLPFYTATSAGCVPAGGNTYV